MARKPVITVGIDPGFAEMGLAALLCDLRTMEVDVLATKVISTKRATKKELRSIRVSADNSRRMEALWEGVHQFLREYRPGLVGIEDYNAYMAQSSSSQKTLAAYGLSFGVCRTLGLVVQTYLPQDLKRTFGLTLGATKKDIEGALCGKMDSLGGFLDAVANSRREHVADAAGHGYLAMTEAARVAAITRGGSRARHTPL